MATMRLIPSAYSVSNANYVVVSDPSNMYDNTSDSSDYASLRGRGGRNSNSTYYAFIHGFNFDDVPSTATVSAFKVKIKAYKNSYMATGNTNYRISLASQASNSYKIGNTTLSEDITNDTDGEVYEIPTGSLTWSTLSGYGSGFSIDVPLRNNSTSSSNYPYVYVYGAEIEVTYTMPNPRTVSTSLTGSGTIVPSGSTTTYDGETFDLTITPTNVSDAVTVSKNGTDVTSSLVTHYVQGDPTTSSTNLGTYTLVSGGFNGSGASYFSGIVGHAYNATTTTSNYYSSGSSTIAVFTYDMGFTLPSGAEVTSLYVMVNGHAESTSQSSEYMCAQLISGSTELSNELNFKSIGTSNSTQTINATTLPTAEQAANMKLQCRLGYYGGAINGATCYITYTVPTSTISHYTYSYEVSGDATILVVIGSSGAQPKLYLKVNGSWVEISAAYKKVNGSWVQQSDVTSLFQSGVNYKKG